MNESNITSNGGAAAPVGVPVYRVANWDEEYETNETRKLKELRWVRWRGPLDELSYRRVAAHPRACEVLAAWGVILQVARGGAHGERGWLMRRGKPLTAEDLAWVSGLPAAVFELALPLLASPAIGWLEVAPKGEGQAGAGAGGSQGSGRSEGSTPAGTAAAAEAEAGGGLRFEPVRRGLYRREYEAMLADVEGEIRAIVEGAGNYERRLRAEEAELIARLEREGRAERAAEVRRRQDAWERVGLRAEAAGRLRAWQQRKAEIKAAMRGLGTGGPSS